MTQGMATGMELPESDTAVMTLPSKTTSSSADCHLSTTTLLDLPPELIIKIFKATKSLATPLALGKARLRLHSIWKLNADVILPSVVECYLQAQKLARTQEKLAQEFPQTEQNTPTHPRRTFMSRAKPLTFASPPKPLSTSQRITLNATLASHTLEAFCTIDPPADTTSVPRTALTTIERTTFLHAFYRAITFLSFNAKGIPRSYLSSLTYLAYWQIFEVLWVLHRVDELSSSPTKLVLFEHSLEIRSAASSGYCDLGYFHMSLPNDPGALSVYGKPFGYFFVEDGYRAKEGGNVKEGPRFAEMMKNMSFRKWEGYESDGESLNALASGG